MCRKIEIKRTTIFFVTLLLKLNLLCISEVKSWPNILLVSSICHNCSLILPHFSTQYEDMCHGTIGSSPIEMLQRSMWDNLVSNLKFQRLKISLLNKPMFLPPSPSSNVILRSKMGIYSLIVQINSFLSDYMHSMTSQASFTPPKLNKPLLHSNLYICSSILLSHITLLSNKSLHFNPFKSSHFALKYVFGPSIHSNYILFDSNNPSCFQMRPCTLIHSN